RLMLSVVSWDGGGDGTHWNDRFNWDTDALPGPGDDAIIGAGSPGSGSVTFSTGSSTVHSVQSDKAFTLSGGTLSLSSASAMNNVFTFSGGTLTGTGDLNLSNSSTWTGGTMSGAGATTIAAGATLAISGTADKALSQRSLSNAGTVT